MKLGLTGPERARLRDALLAAFPSRARLEQMLSIQLEKKLAKLVREGSLDEMTFALIQLAESEGWTSELLAAARAQNPGNPELAALGLQGIAEAPALPLNNLRPRRRFFVGRADELAALDRPTNPAGEPPVTLYGLGGIGKTALALEHAHRSLGRYPGGVWWVEAHGEPHRALARLGLEMEDAGSEPNRGGRRKTEEERATAVRLLLQNNHAPSLLVLDDVDAEGWHELIPAGRVRVLITTRDRRLGLGEETALGRISLPDSIELAQRIAGDPAGEKEARACRRVLVDLGGLPLACERAAGAVKQWSWADYDRALCAQPASVLTEAAATADYPSSVFAALDRSIDRAGLDTPERRLLDAAAWFAPERVPLAWALETAGLRDGLDGRRVLQGLTRLDLARTDGSNEMITLHPLVYLRVGQALTDEARAAAARRGGAAVAAWLRLKVDPARMIEIDARRPHIDAALGAAEQHGLEATWLGIAVWLGRHLYNRGGSLEAHALLERARLKLEARPVEEQGPLVEVLSGLGMALGDLGLPADALRLFERAHALAELRAEEREQATALGNLGTTLRALGRPADALPLLEKAREIVERTSGPAHGRFAAVLAALGGVLHDLGRLEEARRLFERSLAIHERTTGESDPRTAQILTGLSLVLHDLGQVMRAGYFRARAVELARRVHGREHRRVRALEERLRAVRSTDLPSASLDPDLQRTGDQNRPFEPRSSISTIDIAVPSLSERQNPGGARLAVGEGPARKQILLGAERLTIGRAGGAGLPIADDRVSVHHAVIAWTGWAHAVTDLGSASGTFVNDERVEHRELVGGERLRFGSTQLEYVGRGPSPGDPLAADAAYEGPAGPCLLRLAPIARGERETGERIPLLQEVIEIGRSPKANLVIHDLSVSRRHAILTRGGAGYVIEDQGGVSGVSLNHAKIDRALLRNGDRLGLGADTVFRYLSGEGEEPLGPLGPVRLLDTAELTERLGELPLPDVETGPLSIVVVEIDGEDPSIPRPPELGRQLEAMLRARAPLREDDALGRLGDDAFALLLTRTDFDLGRSVAESLRAVVARWPFQDGARALTLTARIGVATLAPDSRLTPRDALAAAREGVELARAAGRDQVVARLLLG